MLYTIANKNGEELVFRKKIQVEDETLEVLALDIEEATFFTFPNDNLEILMKEVSKLKEKERIIIVNNDSNEKKIVAEIKNGAY